MHIYRDTQTFIDWFGPGAFAVHAPLLGFLRPRWDARRGAGAPAPGPAWPSVRRLGEVSVPQAVAARTELLMLSNDDNWIITVDVDSGSES